MPSDILVDMILRMTFINVRKSQVSKLVEAVRQAEIIGPEFDSLVIDGFELVGDMPYGPSTVRTTPSACDNGTPAGWNNMALADSIRQMPSCLPMPVMTPTTSHKGDPCTVDGTTCQEGYCSECLKSVSIPVSASSPAPEKAANVPADAIKEPVPQTTLSRTSPEKPPVDEKPKPPVETRKLVKEIVNLPNGSAKDEKLEQLILRLVMEQPGSSLASISEMLGGLRTTKIRKHLMGLEDAGKIERRMMPTIDGRGVKTGYYLKTREAY